MLLIGINIFLKCHLFYYSQSISAVPTLWCSYLELIPLLSDKDEISSVNIPNHWMKAIFLAHAHVELLLSDKGIKLYNELQRSGFKNSTYMVAQIGKAFHNKRSKANHSNFQRIY